MKSAMLPSLHKLSPTGEFYALGFKEAKEWNEQNPQGETFSLKKIPANCYPDTRNCDPTFRVWVADPVTHNKGTTKYYVYLAKPLWQWYQNQPTDPNNRQFCWSEDWYLLKAKYGLQGAEPEWVQYLPSYNRVRQLEGEREKYLSDLRNAGSGFETYNFMYLRSLANVLIGPDGTLMEDGSTINPKDGWVAHFQYEKAWSVARWLLKSNVLRVIANHLRPQRAEVDNPRQHAWATELLDALMKAVAKRWEGRNADHTELYNVVNDVFGTPDLLHGLTEYAHWIAVTHANVINEKPWELTPLRILHVCAATTQKTDDWRHAMALATDRVLDTLEQIFRPMIPEQDTADAGYGYVYRVNSKMLAQRMVWCLSNHSSARVRARLMRRELLLAITKFSMLQLDQHSRYYEEDDEFRRMASAVLTNLRDLSPDAQAMVDQLKSEVTSLVPTLRRSRRLVG
tara:strand:- start:44 stop:1408 length:1365 start_codon:yes stop_codon:yes gene_type:complete